MKDPIRARADVRKAWRELKAATRPIWGLLLAFGVVALALTWAASVFLRWVGLVDLPWWSIPPLAVVVYYGLQIAVVRVGNAIVRDRGGDGSDQ